ncbi:hypothetical protein PRZ48_011238 [Zasmidium cellare]|uniref:Uncharacterized protein n=1 Tax=Zasmidium cellare TaxID=395010 RepID=A0ABR0EBC1_ZASCE|nr:hypothetical protein PRZ48_011238 [Zasmidium cellare]
MSFITTAIPSGTGYDWCINQLYAEYGSTEIFQCANSTRGTNDSDFETICCDGPIIDQSQNLYSFEKKEGPTYVDIANLVCCQIEGPQAGGLMPIFSNDGLTCSTGTPTPLASMAATNVNNAQIYPLTFTSASGTVTVPAAKITTLPNGWPDSNSPLISATPTSMFGMPAGITATRLTGAAASSLESEFATDGTQGMSSPVATGSSATAEVTQTTTEATSTSGTAPVLTGPFVLLAIRTIALMVCML